MAKLVIRNGLKNRASLEGPGSSPGTATTVCGFESHRPHLVYVAGYGFTCGIVIDDNNIIQETAPILRKFRGQGLHKLLRWKGVEYVIFYPLMKR